jgi:integrase
LPVAKLSKRAIDGLRPGETPFILFDADLKGFGVRVQPSGQKSYVVEYRPGSGGRGVGKRRVTIGAVTTLTPDEARRAARDYLAKVQLGCDPAAERRAERVTPSLADLIDAYIADEVRPKREPATVAIYALHLEKHVKPLLGTKKATLVSHADVARLHREIGATRKPTANRIVRVLSGLFSYAERRGIIPKGSNPAKGIEPFKEEGRERFLTSDELQRLGAALREAETVGLAWEVRPDNPKAKHAPKVDNRREVYPPHVTGAIRLLLFTGCRLREILHLRWRDVDFERGLLFLPKSKTGKKTVVLNAPALAVLASLPRVGSFVIFGAKLDAPRSDLKRPWDAVAARAGLSGVRLHDLRHSFASVGAGAGMGLPIVGKLLGHASTATTERYAHLDADPLRVASERIGGRISAALDGAPGASVIPLRERGGRG